MIARLEREGVKPEIIEQVSKNFCRFRAEKLTEKVAAAGGLTGLFAGIIVGVLLLMSIILHGQNILRGVLEEKTTRVAEIVISSVKPEALLAGKVLGVGGVGLTQMVAWVALTFYLEQLPHSDRAQGGRREQRRNQWRRRCGGCEPHRGVDLRRHGRRRAGHLARLLPHRLPVLRDAVRGRRLDGEQRAGSAAGRAAGHHPPDDGRGFS